jgi:hypothetical protein
MPPQIPGTFPPTKEIAVDEYLTSSPMLLAACNAEIQPAAAALLAAARVRYAELDGQLKNAGGKAKGKKLHALLGELKGLQWVLSIPASAEAHVRRVQESEENSA